MIKLIDSLLRDPDQSFITVRNSSCGKVIFSQVSVCPVCPQGEV